MTPQDPWTRFGVVVHLARAMEDIKKQLGKTVLQKLVYLAQELFACPLGYRFRLYNYGPYSRRLASDLDYLESIHALDIEYDADEGYSILPGRRAQDMEHREKRFLADWDQKLYELLDEFGVLQAWQLEIYATAILVDRDHVKFDEKVSVEILTEEVAQIKRRHDRNYIGTAIRELHKKHYLRSTAA